MAYIYYSSEFGVIRGCLCVQPWHPPYTFSLGGMNVWATLYLHMLSCILLCTCPSYHVSIIHIKQHKSFQEFAEHLFQMMYNEKKNHGDQSGDLG